MNLINDRSNFFKDPGESAGRGEVSDPLAWIPLPLAGGPTIGSQ